MRITTSVLRQYNACDSGIKYIERFYPDGAEMIKVIQDKHISKEFLFWGRENLYHSSEELAAYEEACNIINSSNHWRSVNLSDSHFVVNSKNINDSQRVYDSSDVTGGLDIVSSDEVTLSGQIFASSFIAKSNRINKSKNVHNSINICDSILVGDSKNILQSNNVFSSSEIIRSENVENSFFCQDCKNIKNCMFCFGLTDAEYYVFNQPVGKSKFELFVAQYKKLMEGELAFVTEWPQDLLKGYGPVPVYRFDKWFYPVPEKLWKWSNTLPGYTKEKLYQTTMLPYFLMN